MVGYPITTGCPYFGPSASKIVNAISTLSSVDSIGLDLFRKYGQGIKF